MNEIRKQIERLRGSDYNGPMTIRTQFHKDLDAIADSMEKMLAVVEAADVVSRSNGMSCHEIETLNDALAALRELAGSDDIQGNE